MRFPVVMALLIRAANGIGVGAYLIVYARILSAFGSEALGIDLKSSSSEIPGRAFILWIFICVLSLRMSSGYFVQKFGFRAAMIVAFAARTAFFLFLIFAVSHTDSSGFLFAFVFGGAAFAAGYVLIEGNFENFLREMVAEEGVSRSIFGWTSAIQTACTILGSLVAVACLGTSVRPTDLLGESLLWLPYGLAAFLSASVAVLAFALPRSKRQDAPKSSLRAEADLAFGRTPAFRKLTWLAAIAATLTQGMSVLVPLIVLSRSEFTTFQRWLILGLGTFGPQMVGNLRQAFSQRIRTAGVPGKTPSGPAPRRFGVAGCIVAMAAASTIFCAGVFALEWGLEKWVCLAILFAALIAQRYFFGIFEPSQRQLATGVLRANDLTHLEGVMMSSLEWWKALGGFTVTLVSIAVVYLVADVRIVPVADSVMLVAAAGLAFAAAVDYRRSNRGVGL